MKILFEKEISTRDIIVSPKPVWKCRTCPAYGKALSCPPHVPSWHEARQWIECFRRALFIKFQISRNDYQADKREALHYLLGKEKEFFKSGSLYTCALFPGNCNLCDECTFATNGSCALPDRVRPSVDAVGIELTSLVAIDFNESVLYGLVLID